MEQQNIDAWFNEVMADEHESCGTYIYENKAGEIVAVSEQPVPELEGSHTRSMWYDEVIIEPRGETGVIYFDRLGTIRAISFHEQSELAAQWEHITLSKLIAEQMLNGELPVDEWCVGYTTTNRTMPQLLPKSATNRLIKLSKSEEWVRVVNSTPGPVMLSARVGIEERKLRLRLLRTIDVTTDLVDFLVLFTAPEDMATIFQGVTISMEQLLKDDVYVTLTFDPSIAFDIYLPDIFGCAERHVSPFVSNIIPLPTGHFSDLVCVPRKAIITPSLTVVILRDECKIRFEFDRDHGVMYDRDISKIPVMLTIRNDMAYMLHSECIKFEPILKEGWLEMSIPDGLINNDFDVVLPLLFETMVLRTEYV